MRTWKDVATLVKTKNLKGRFVARPAANLPFALYEGVQVAFVPPQTDLPRAGIVNYLAERGDGSYEVGFDTVTDETGAHGLVGCHCLMRVADLEQAIDYDSPQSWSGWRVMTPDGDVVGTVAGLVENPGQSLLEVERGGGLALSYIPVVDAFIVDVDEQSREVTVDVPEGLLTLNDRDADGESA